MSIDGVLQDVINRWAAAGSNRPFYMGIGGGSASGKSTLAAHMAERLAPLRVQVVGQDSFFKKPEDMPQYYSNISGQYHPAYNEPDSFKQSEMFSACRALQEAECDVVILEGILVLWLKIARIDGSQTPYRGGCGRAYSPYSPQYGRLKIAFITDYYLMVRWQHAQYNATSACRLGITRGWPTPMSGQRRAFAVR